MPSLYKSYCYPDVLTAAKAEMSEPYTFLYDTTWHIVYGKSATLLSSDTATLNYMYNNLAGTVAPFSINRTYQSCEVVGSYPPDITDPSVMSDYLIVLGMCILFAFGFTAGYRR